MRKSVTVPVAKEDSPAPSLGSVVRKSSLLDVVIHLTSAPVLMIAGEPKAVVVILEIMVAISVLIWTTPFHRILASHASPGFSNAAVIT